MKFENGSYHPIQNSLSSRPIYKNVASYKNKHKSSSGIGCFGKYLHVREAKYQDAGETGIRVLIIYTLHQQSLGWPNQGERNGQVNIMHGKVRNVYRIMVWKHNDEILLEDQGLHTRIILKTILKKQDVGVYLTLDSTCSGRGLVAFNTAMKLPVQGKAWKGISK